MKEKINEIHEIIKELYPEAVSVEVFVNSEGIEVMPNYRINARSRRFGKFWNRKRRSDFN